jgi:hypothetical protein
LKLLSYQHLDRQLPSYFLVMGGSWTMELLDACGGVYDDGRALQLVLLQEEQQ